MANLRGSSNFYDVGNKPPLVSWTVVRGDTASFRVYVTDDDKQPLNITDWTIRMTIKRPVVLATPPEFTDNASHVLDLHPGPDADDGPGEFTVFLAAAESNILESGDIFDIELSLPQNQLVWTVAQGYMVILEDVTD